MTTEATPAGTATPAAAPVVETPAAPATPPERSLADYVADHSRQVQEYARLGRPEPVASAPAAIAAPAEKPAVAPPATLPVQAAEPAKAEPAADPSAAATPKPDDKPAEEKPTRAKELADFVRLQQANRAEQARLKAERAAFKAEQESARAALEAEKTATTASKAEIEKFEREFATDPVSAVMRRLGSEKFRTDFLLSALDRAGKDEDVPAPVMSEADKQKLIEEAASAKALEKLRDEQKKAEDAKKAEAEQRNLAAQERYFGQMNEFLAANVAQYPNMAEEGWDTKDMVSAIEQHVSATGQWPTVAMVLDHFEAKHVARAEKYAKRMGLAKPAEPPKPSPAAAPVKSPLDARGKPSTTPDTRTPAEKKAEILARLEGQRVGA